VYVFYATTAILYLQSVLVLVLLASFNSFLSAFIQCDSFNRSNYSNCSRILDSFVPNTTVNSTGKVEVQFGEADDRVHDDKMVPVCHL
jgi:hypothetical protein